MRTLRVFLLLLICALMVSEPARAALNWESIGPDGGDLFVIESAPGIPDDLYAVSFLGVFRSSDAAATWQPVHTPEMGFGFTSITFDVLNSSHAFLASGRTGIWESLDKGASWTNCRTGLPTQPATVGNPEVYYPVSSIVAMPDGTLFAGLGAVAGVAAPPAWVYRSDGGCNWVPDSTGFSFDAPEFTQDISAVLTIGNDQRLWAMVYGAGVYLYQDGSWVSANGNLPLEALRTTRLVMDPADGDRLLLGTEREWIYESVDAGLTWTALPLPLDLLALPVLPLVYNVEIDPNNSQLIYALALDGSTSGETPVFSTDFATQVGGLGGYLSVTGGQDWSSFPNPFLRIHFDASETVSTDFPPHGAITRSRVWYATSFGDTNLLKTGDGGLGFYVANDGIASVLVNKVWRHPSPPSPYDNMLFVAAEEGINSSTDDGASWVFQKSVPNTNYTWSFASDPSDLNNLYYSTGNPARSYTGDRGIYRIALDCLGDACPAAEQVLSDTGVWRVITTPVQPTTLYAATQEEGILVSSDQGLNWSTMNTGLVLPQSVTDIALDADGNPLLAATRTDNGDITAEPAQAWLPYPEETGGVYRRDAGLWVLSPDITNAVYDLEVSPSDALTFFAATAEGISVTNDGGLAWTTVYPYGLVYDLVTDPGRPDYIYAATPTGVLRSTDGGTQWHDLSDGLWQTNVLSLALDDATGTLYAGTAGGSVFRLVPDPAPQPVISLDPASLVFDATPIGFLQDVTVTLTNAGEADLTVTNITSDNPAFTIVDFVPSTTVTPRGEMDLTIRYSPPSEGITSGTVTINTNDPVTPVFAYSVSGEGRAAVPPVLDLKLDDVDGPLTIANGDTLNVTALLSPGDYVNEAADFWLRHTLPDGTTLWLVEGTGWIESVTPMLFRTGSIVDVGGSILSVSVTGLSTGVNNVDFFIDDNTDGVFDGTWTDSASFTVEPTPPAVFVSPATLDFGPVAVGFSGSVSFGLVNTGEADLVVNSIDTGHADLALIGAPAFPLTVVAGTPVILTLGYSPQSEGVISTALTINSNDPVTSAFSYPVSGEGVAAVPPVVDLKLNNLDGPLTVTRGSAVIVTATVSTGDYENQQADFWLRHTRPDGTTSWLVEGTGWVESATPMLFRVGPILDPGGPVLSVAIAGTSIGVNDVQFSIDNNTDGVFDGTWTDSASFTVEPTPPAVFVSPATLDFGPVAVGFSGSASFGLVNTGEADLVVNSIDTGHADLALIGAPAFPLTVVAGTPVILTLGYSPQSEGVISTALTINSNAPVTPAFSYPVSGEGVAAVPPLCEVATSQPTYVNGETVSMSSLRYANPNAATLPARLRLQLQFGTFLNVDLIDAGGGGEINLPSGFDLLLGPLNLFTVSTNFPRGTWQFRCALEDPVSGVVQAESFAVFELQ